MTKLGFPIRAFVVPLFVLALLAVAACGSRTDLKVSDAGGGCATNADCPPGETCDSATQQCVVIPCAAGGTCAGGLACCALVCVDESSDTKSCGACGNACANPPRATAGCHAGVCGVGRCDPGYGDCDGDAQNGCEANTNDESQNCGACGAACPSGCRNGTCPDACKPDGTCSGNRSCCESSCTDTMEDEQNCGACGVACASGDSCVAGKCVPPCGDGPVCRGVTTCCSEHCVDTTLHRDNCGGCGIVCGPHETCAASSCVAARCHAEPACAASQACCPSGCSDMTSDPNNCGGCGAACAVSETCVAGICRPTSCSGGSGCPLGSACCGGACIDANADPNNCGACGVACTTTTFCTDGTCAVNEGALDPIVNPTYLTPGVHLYTTINIRAGMVVYVRGAGDASGTLDLHATGAIVIDGTIDLSGGPGTQDSVPTPGEDGASAAGSGGYTGEPYRSAPTSSVCRFVAGNPGALGDAVGGSTGVCPVVSTSTCTTLDDGLSVFTAPLANYGGGAGVVSVWRAYGSGGGGPAGGGPGGLGPAAPPERNGADWMDCTGVTAGGGAVDGRGGYGGSSLYGGASGTLGQGQCTFNVDIGPEYVGGGGGGSIGAGAAGDLAVLATFRTGSGGGGGSADHVLRPGAGGTSGGGGGGGALKLVSPISITVRGSLLAKGGDGGDASIGSGQASGCVPEPGAAGGGGSGGVVYLAAPSIDVAPGAIVSAAGGAGGASSPFASGGVGGKGGVGRVRLSVAEITCALSGTIVPPLASGCDPTTGGVPGFAYVGTYPR